MEKRRARNQPKQTNTLKQPLQPAKLRMLEKSPSGSIEAEKKELQHVEGMLARIGLEREHLQESIRTEETFQLEDIAALAAEFQPPTLMMQIERAVKNGSPFAKTSGR